MSNDEDKTYHAVYFDEQNEVDQQRIKMLNTPSRLLPTSELIGLVAAGAAGAYDDCECGSPDCRRQGLLNTYRVKAGEALDELDRRFPIPPLAEGEEPTSAVKLERHLEGDTNRGLRLVKRGQS